ncbi:hypothetical protein N7462_002130 [Penicillium macrosclerotiorum]|uniref:uncharacterized protein n=1 Tax=Penicillium macrosclerotiorum TaxID=303699 RepID=UPI0025490BE3|nr:uncharacterized protein N7462_002130 [Penicillium macrosclerotiorum]KAJ5692707.1 hypothetical protein N7462_002130 [Penicillium macrosclerotiorum]
MQLLSIVSAMALVPAVFSAPGSDFKRNELKSRDSDRGSYTVSGLGARKQAVLSAGGNTLDIAIAMLETETMTTDYTYGDGKTGDSTNFGIFKQNWFMLRTSASEFLGETTSQVADGAILNSDLTKDVTARHDSQNHYGYDVWFAGHRDGESGIQDPNTADITAYKEAVEWIQQQVDSNAVYQTDDTRFWVDIQAI